MTLMESVMPHSRAMPADHAAYPELCSDWIEQKIIRAYVQLAVGPGHGETSRTVTLGRFGTIEISLTEEYGAEMSGLPPFWLEVRAQESGGTIDRIGCHEFDEDEMAAAVAFVQEADRRLRVLH
ncbi:hypothetical protein AB4097_02190 [Microvirga sp. 2MCAF35]|uniref:hypothetical protein n=1 Tax=Microvirga sp. 2MCAF35 TaxID=3232987 RepID=UPI003F9CA25D